MSRRLAIFQLVLAVGVATMSIGFLVATIVGYAVAALPNPPPSLSGIEPEAVGGVVPMDPLGPERGTYGLPAGWAKGDWSASLAGGGALIFVYDWPAPSGVPLATPAERRRAVELLMRVEHARIAPPREITVAGRPALEIAGANGKDDWELHAYVFGDGHVTEVRCLCHTSTSRGFLIWKKSRQNWARVAPGCAAVVSSLQVGK